MRTVLVVILSVTAIAGVQAIRTVVVAVHSG